MTDRSSHLLPLKVAACKFGVPSVWLREEARAGRLPSLLAGNRFLFDPTALEEALLKRAQGDGETLAEASASELGMKEGGMGS